MAADKATAQQADLPVIEIGTKIRFTRRLRSLTLKEVAAATGCSESLLSKIENGHASPSLKMLQRLTHALGLTVGQLFAQEANPDDIVMRAATRVAFDTELGGRSRVEPLAPHSGGHLLECHLHHFAPGSDSGGDLQHESEKFGYVLAARSNWWSLAGTTPRRPGTRSCSAPNGRTQSETRAPGKPGCCGSTPRRHFDGCAGNL